MKRTGCFSEAALITLMACVVIFGGCSGSSSGGDGNGNTLPQAETTALKLTGDWMSGMICTEGCEDYITDEPITEPWRIVQNENKITINNSESITGEINGDIATFNASYWLEGFQIDYYANVSPAYFPDYPELEDIAMNGTGEITLRSAQSGELLCTAKINFALVRLTNDTGAETSGTTSPPPTPPTNTTPTTPEIDHSAEADRYCGLAEAKKKVYDACINDNPDAGPWSCESEKSDWLIYERLCIQYR